MASHYVAAPPRLGRFVVRGPHPKPCCSILSVPPPPWMLCYDQGPHCECVCECEYCTLTPSIGYGPTRNQAIFTLSRGAGYEIFRPCYTPIIIFFDLFLPILNGFHTIYGWRTFIAPRSKNFHVIMAAEKYKTMYNGDWNAWESAMKSPIGKAKALQLIFPAIQGARVEEEVVPRL